MTKKLLIFIIILAALLILYFVYNYFANPEVKAPTIGNDTSATNNSFKSPSSVPGSGSAGLRFQIPTSTNFKGPTGSPYVKGPTGPPPGQ